MSQTVRSEFGSTEDTIGEKESLESVEGPVLEVDTGDFGYLKINSDDLERFESSEWNTDHSLDYYTGLTDSNPLLGPEISAKILDHYLGQYNFSDSSLREVLGGRLDGLEAENKNPYPEGGAVLELETFDYSGGDRYIDRREGRVADEVVEFLVDESAWKDRVQVLEDNGEDVRLFIRSNP